MLEVAAFDRRFREALEEGEGVATAEQMARRRWLLLALWTTNSWHRWDQSCFVEYCRCRDRGEYATTQDGMEPDWDRDAGHDSRGRRTSLLFAVATTCVTAVAVATAIAAAAAATVAAATVATAATATAIATTAWRDHRWRWGSAWRDHRGRTRSRRGCRCLRVHCRPRLRPQDEYAYHREARRFDSSGRPRSCCPSADGGRREGT